VAVPDVVQPALPDPGQVVVREGKRRRSFALRYWAARLG
jgi:hypothetical protein